MRPNLKRRLCVEALENRCVPAGNVLAEMSGGILRITGDQFDNSLLVDGYLSGEVIVRPGPDTSVNGGTDGLLFAGVDRVEISTGDGDDQIGSYWASPADVIIDTGHGADQLTWLSMEMVGNLVISTGDGQDRIDVDARIHTGSVQIDAGNGNDFIVVGPHWIEGDLAVYAGNGDDEVYLFGYEPFGDNVNNVFGDVTIDGGNGRGDALHGLTSVRWLFEFEGDVNISDFEIVD